MKHILEYLNEKTKKSNVYLLVGVPGSGKSEWCKREHPELPVVSRDIIRGELGYTSGVDEKVRLEPWQENIVTRKEQEKIKEYCRDGEDFIIDDTNLKKKLRKQMIDLLHQNNAYVIGVRFSTDIETCIRRRQGQIPEDRMREIFARMCPLEENEVDEIIDTKNN